MQLLIHDMRFRLDDQTRWQLTERGAQPAALAEALLARLNGLDLNRVEAAQPDRAGFEDLRTRHYPLYVARLTARALAAELVDEPREPLDYPDDRDPFPDEEPAFTSLADARAELRRLRGET